MRVNTILAGVLVLSVLVLVLAHALVTAWVVVSGGLGLFFYLRAGQRRARRRQAAADQMEEELRQARRQLDVLAPGLSMTSARMRRPVPVSELVERQMRALGRADLTSSQPRERQPPPER